MRLVMKINAPESASTIINIDEECVYIESSSDKLLIDTKYEDRFNTLISLFALKNEWSTSSDYSMYEILFEKDGNIENYSFNEVPDNWLLFNSYIVRLVGDSL